LGAAKVGMSRGAVRRLYPKADFNGSGNLAIRSRFRGDPSTVEFIFIEDGLARVSVTTSANSEEVANDLAKRHGDPQACGSTPLGAIVCRWRSGALKIETYSISMAGARGTEIQYSPTEASGL
jgi:hypothetical protein